MKLHHYIGLMALVLTGLLTLGCELGDDDDGVSIEDRINAFEQDLNTRNFDMISENFHSEMQSGQQAKWDQLYADNIFAESNAPFVFDEPSSILDGATNEKNVFGNYSNGIGANQTYTFVMKEETSGDGIWKIKQFRIDDLDIFRLIQ